MVALVKLLIYHKVGIVPQEAVSVLTLEKLLLYHKVGIAISAGHNCCSVPILAEQQTAGGGRQADGCGVPPRQ